MPRCPRGAPALGSGRHGGLPLASGVTAALWAAAATIVVLEIAAGWQSRPRTQGFLLQAGAGAAVGLALIGLKLVLNH